MGLWGVDTDPHQLRQLSEPTPSSTYTVLLLARPYHQEIFKPTIHQQLYHYQIILMYSEHQILRFPNARRRTTRCPVYIKTYPVSLHNDFSNRGLIREAAKYGLILVARPLRPYPPPSSLLATKNFQNSFSWAKKNGI